MAEVTTQQVAMPWMQKQYENEQAQKKAWETAAIQAGEARMPYWNEYIRLANKGGRTLEETEKMHQMKSKADQLEGEMVANQKRIKGIDPATGEPLRPEFYSLLDPNTGLLAEQYKLGIGTLTGEDLANQLLDPTKLKSYGLIEKEATRTGASDWAKLQQQQNEMKRLEGLEQVARQSESGAAAARSGLAMRGGMSAGARERIAKSQMINMMEGRQGVGRTARMADIQLLSDDERNRLEMLNRFGGMETDLNKFNIGQRTDQDKFNISNRADRDKFNIEAEARAKGWNIENALREKAAGENYKMDTYKAQLNKYGAEKQAQATQNSGGGGK